MHIQAANRYHLDSRGSTIYVQHCQWKQMETMEDFLGEFGYIYRMIATFALSSLHIPTMPRRILKTVTSRSLKHSFLSQSKLYPYATPPGTSSAARSCPFKPYFRYCSVIFSRIPCTTTITKRVRCTPSISSERSSRHLLGNVPDTVFSGQSSHT